MDSSAPTSFIPKKPLTPLARNASAMTGNLFVLIGAFLLVVSLLAAGAAFGYQSYLNTSIKQQSDSLQKAQAAFDPSTIQDLSRLDVRINNAESLLQKHVAASAIFGYLATQTLQNVQFTQFTYTLAEDGSADIELVGTAADFATLALQSDQLNASKTLKDVVFSGIAVSNGKVSFDVKATIDPSLINYAKDLNVTPATDAGSLSTPPSAATTTGL